MELGSGCFRDWIEGLRPEVHLWSQRNRSEVSGPYIDLIFAYGLARLGETQTAQCLVDQVKDALPPDDDIHQFLQSAYSFRIQEALTGHSPVPTLPSELLQHLEMMSKIDRYKINVLRSHSRILEPFRRPDPYALWVRQLAPKFQVRFFLNDLAALQDIDQAINQLDAKLQETLTVSDHVQLLRFALEIAPECGLDQARAWLEKCEVYATFENSATIELMTTSLIIAQYFQLTTFAERCMTKLNAFLTTSILPPFLMDDLQTQMRHVVDSACGLGLNDSIDQLLVALESNLSETEASDEYEACVLASLAVQISGGRFMTGQEPACASLDQARGILFSDPFRIGDHVGRKRQADLGNAYIWTVGQTPWPIACDLIEEFMQRQSGIFDTGTYNTHYSLKHLVAVETLFSSIIQRSATPKIHQNHRRPLA